MSIFKISLSLIILFFTKLNYAGEHQLNPHFIPELQTIQRGFSLKDSFVLNSSTKIITVDAGIATDADISAADMIREMLDSIGVTVGAPEYNNSFTERSNIIVFCYGANLFSNSFLALCNTAGIRQTDVIDSLPNDEGYFLEVRKDFILVAGKGHSGAYYGVMTLLQLMQQSQGNNVFNCRIKDWPDMGRRHSQYFSLNWNDNITNIGLERKLKYFSSLKYNTVTIDYWPFMDAGNWNSSGNYNPQNNSQPNVYNTINEAYTIAKKYNLNLVTSQNTPWSNFLHLDVNSLEGAFAKNEPIIFVDSGSTTIARLVPYVANASFSDNLNDWQQQSDGTGYTGLALKDTLTSPASCSINVTNGHRTVKQNIVCLKNTSYTLEYWAKTRAVNINDTTGLYVKIFSGNDTLYRDSLKNDREWRNYTGKYNSENHDFIVLQFIVRGQATALFDNIEINRKVIIKNNSFEDGTNGWHLDNNPDVTINSDAHEGKSSLKMVGIVDNDWHGFYTDDPGIDVDSAYWYRISFWAKSHITSNESSLEFLIKDAQSTFRYYNFASLSIKDATENWKYYSGVWYSKSKKVFIIMRTKFEGYVLLDDIEIQPLNDGKLMHVVNNKTNPVDVVDPNTSDTLTGDCQFDHQFISYGEISTAIDNTTKWGIPYNPTPTKITTNSTSIGRNSIYYLCYDYAPVINSYVYFKQPPSCPYSTSVRQKTSDIVNWQSNNYGDQIQGVNLTFDEMLYMGLDRACRLSGKSNAEIFADIVTATYNTVKAAKPDIADIYMYADMLMPYHNGYIFSNHDLGSTVPAISLIPNDIILIPWFAADERLTVWQWPTENNYSWPDVVHHSIDTLESLNKKYMVAGYHHWLRNAYHSLYYASQKNSGNCLGITSCPWSTVWGYDGNEYKRYNWNTLPLVANLSWHKPRASSIDSEGWFYYDDLVKAGTPYYNANDTVTPAGAEAFHKINANYGDIFVCRVDGFKAKPDKPNSRIKLSWTKSTEKDLNRYLIYRATADANCQPGQFVKIDSVYQTSTTLEWYDVNANNFSVYFYYVTALDHHFNDEDHLGHNYYNESDTSEIFGAALDNTQPNSPTDFTAQAYDINVNLFWTKSSSPDVNFYRIYRRTGSGTFSAIAVCPDTVAYIDTTVVNNTIYSYYITAVDYGGNESDPSNSRNNIMPQVYTANIILSTKAETLDLSKTYFQIIAKGIMSSGIDMSNLTSIANWISSDTSILKTPSNGFLVKSNNYGTVRIYCDWMNERPESIYSDTCIVVVKNSGNLSRDTTWDQNITLTGDVIIPDSVTLRIKGPVAVKCSSNYDDTRGGLDTSRCEIITYGKLVTEVVSGSGPTFTSTGHTTGDWYGIQLDGNASACSLHTTGIHYANYGIRADSSLNMNYFDGGAAIRYCNTGIYGHKSAITVYGNVADCADKGVYLNNCTGRIGSINYSPEITRNNGEGIKLDFCRMLVDNARVHDNEGSGIYLSQSLGDTVRASSIWNNGNGLGCGILVVGGNNLIVSGNKIYNNHDYGTWCNESSPLIQFNTIYRNFHGGIRASANAAPSIINNTLAGNSDSVDYGINLWGTSSIITNNIISSFNRGINDGTSQAALSHNTLWDNDSNYVGIAAGATDTVADPLFADAAHDDYNLRVESPCRDRGLDDNTTDYNGAFAWQTGTITRYYGAAPDRGAMEFAAFGTLDTTTTWSGKITVIGDVIVPADCELKLKPGTQVVFAANHDETQSGGLSAKSEIIARGPMKTVRVSSSDIGAVLFTSSSNTPQSGDWGGIRLDTAKACVLDRCVFEYGTNAITVKGAYGPPPAYHSIKNAIFRNLAGKGVNLDNGLAILDRCQFWDNVAGHSVCGNNNGVLEVKNSNFKNNGSLSSVILDHNSGYIRGCRFSGKNNVGTGVQLFGDGAGIGAEVTENEFNSLLFGVYINDFNCEIGRNLFINNGAGVYTLFNSARDVYVYNNTFDGKFRSNGYGLYIVSAAPIVSNNIFYDLEKGIYEDPGAICTTKVFNNSFYNRALWVPQKTDSLFYITYNHDTLSSEDSLTQSAKVRMGNVAAPYRRNWVTEPLFVDNLTYGLQSNSLLKNAGTEDLNANGSIGYYKVDGQNLPEKSRFTLYLRDFDSIPNIGKVEECGSIVLSPIDIMVVDPNGNYINRAANTIGTSAYYRVTRRTDYDGGNVKAEKDIAIRINPMLAGTYIFKITRDSTAADADWYGFAWIYNGRKKVLADTVFVPVAGDTHVYYFVVDKTAPGQVTGLVGYRADSVTTLQWSVNTAADLMCYNVYRDTASGFIANSRTFIGRVNGDKTCFYDYAALSGVQYYYRVTAVDSSGNGGAASAWIGPADLVQSADVVDDFENVSDWSEIWGYNVGAPPSGHITLATDTCRIENAHSMKVHYIFDDTLMEDVRIKKSLCGECDYSNMNILGFWVYGDSSGIGLQVSLGNDSGCYIWLNTASRGAVINWKGWKRFDVPLSAFEIGWPQAPAGGWTKIKYAQINLNDYCYGGSPYTTMHNSDIYVDEMKLRHDPAYVLVENFDDVSDWSEAWGYNVGAPPSGHITMNSNTDTVLIGPRSGKIHYTLDDTSLPECVKMRKNYTEPLILSCYGAVGFWLYGDSSNAGFQVWLGNEDGQWIWRNTASRGTLLNYKGWRKFEIPFSEFESGWPHAPKDGWTNIKYIGFTINDECYQGCGYNKYVNSNIYLDDIVVFNSSYPLAKSAQHLAENNNPLRQEAVQDAMRTASMPNPFKDFTTISYSVDLGYGFKAQVGLVITDIQGNKIKTLTSQEQPGGNYKMTWDGTNNTGARVKEGVYIYRLMIQDRTKTGRIMFLK